jgi:glycine/D-amino acid oxidase-like deaminating enzyme
MGSRELLPDNACVPIRGQIRRVKAPWMKHAWFLDDSYYILPQVDCVVIGGTQQRGNNRESVDPVDTKRIWETITTHWPSLKTAEVLTDWVRAPCSCWSGLQGHSRHI